MAATETTRPHRMVAPLKLERFGAEEEEKVEEASASRRTRRERKLGTPTSGGWYKLSYSKSQKLTTRLRQKAADQQVKERADSPKTEEATNSPLEREAAAALGHESSRAQASHLPTHWLCDIMRLDQSEADNLIRCSPRVAWPSPHTLACDPASDSGAGDRRQEVRKPQPREQEKLHWPTSEFEFTGQENALTSQLATTKSPPPPPLSSIASIEKYNSNYANAIQVPTQVAGADGGGTGQPIGNDASKISARTTTSPSGVGCHQHLETTSKQLKPSAAGNHRPSRLLPTALALLAVAVLVIALPARAALQNDPRPTIYSGQVSFGLLLSAHSSPGSDLTSAAAAAAASSIDYRFAASTHAAAASEQQANRVTTSGGSIASTDVDGENTASITPSTQTTAPSLVPALFKTTPAAPFGPTAGQAARDNQSLGFENERDDLLAIASEFGEVTAAETTARHGRRQIFERLSHQVRRQQQQQQLAASKQPQVAALESDCSQANPSALYAGMSAIWASHQANLVGDSQLAIGTYVYDSCNDLDVGQRQSVRIVSNLNAFQQTTCESPRGSPISLTIAHGDNQLRAIQLLTSFKVPVITTREPFALEDYHLLTRDQRRFLFSTAPSSRHLAVGALKYTKRVVSRTVASPKLPNQHHRMSSKNGLIVISRNLPAKFIAYLTETIPNHVNYEMLQSDQPIDQVRSVEVLESILMLNKQQSSSDSSSFASSTSSPGGATTSAANSAESRLSLVKVEPPEVLGGHKQHRASRSLTSDDSEAAGSSTGGGDQDDSSSSGDQTSEGAQQLRMLSPTILMFITPSEAIDLVTRLRNDLAEVSRYYSLVVATREDISPALRTIFHRGGSRLCSGKAFYTISPQPDEVHEFSRYFRDTVQMEGQSSDHPLICEFAKHQASSRSALPGGGDLDDISAEAVIKAVWSAAAAFKLVHKRECGGSQDSPDETSPLASSSSSYARGAKLHKQGRRQSAGNQTSGANKAPSGGGGQSECMAKMSKNMSNLVQRALRKLDVTINSTGLQALDGFRIKFDESNELLTSKFSIKYINRECEITELGQYSGAKDSQLHLDEETLAKSLESTVPDPWPITAAAAPSSSKQAAVAASAASRSTGLTSGGGGLSLDSPAAGSDDGATSGDSSSGQLNDSGATVASSDESPRTRGGGGDDEHDSSSGDSDKLPSITLESDSPKRRRSSSGKLSKRKIQQQHDGAGAAASPAAATTNAPTTIATPTSISSGRGTTIPVPTESTARPAPPSAHLTSSVSPTTNATRLSTNGPSLPALMQTNSVGTTESNTPKPMRELKPFPGGSPGSSLKEWLPKSSQRGEETTETPTHHHREQVSPQDAMQTTSTTQAPVYSTLPESGGNTDLEMPAFKASGQTPAPMRGSGTRARSSLETAASALTETSTSSDYVTLPSIVRLHGSEETPSGTQMNATHHRSSVVLPMSDQQLHLSHLRDLSVSPVPLTIYAAAAGQGQPFKSTTTIGPDHNHQHHHDHLQHHHQQQHQQQQRQSAEEAQQSSRSRLRSHLKWIYGSWFTLTILGANICGALFTLYVLTFLLMKNCDGSLDRENQGTRSMHLLAIIVVFFGSTLYIVYPTPSLCLLRTSWHNFALVLVFGSLLLQTMQTRSVSSLGLGGRPNRLNQFLTLVFMVGVQVSFELQRWKYESANYINFVNQYFNSQDNGEKKLVIFSNSISGQFNPLNSFNDQVTPVSIQLSEKYQTLLHDYCTQPVEDYLQSQIYLWLIIGLLILFSITGRRHAGGGGGPSATNHGLLMTTSAGRAKGGRGKATLAAPSYNLTSGKLLASQHETNEFLPTSSHHHHHHQAFSGAGPFSPTATAAEHLGLASGQVGRWNSGAGQLGNVFVVTLISAPVYFFSVVMYVHGQELASPDLVASVSMVLIAFVVLIGTFMPLMRNYHKYGELTTGAGGTSSSSDQLGGGSAASLSRPIMSQHHYQFAGSRGAGDKLSSQPNRRSQGSSQNSPLAGSNSAAAAFLMFPEFAATGLRRPSSMGGDSSGGGGATRRPFAETKESRRNMGLSLANLPEPLAAADSLRSLCVHNHRAQSVHQHLPPADYAVGGDHHLIPQANLNNNIPSPAEHHQHHQRINNNHDHRLGNGRISSGSGNNTNQRPRKSHGGGGGGGRCPSRRSSAASSGGGGGGEKRLIMLDVDPCCPRHGLGAVTTTNSGGGG